MKIINAMGMLVVLTIVTLACFFPTGKIVALGRLCVGLSTVIKICRGS
jgi:hypothetical protein